MSEVVAFEGFRPVRPTTRGRAGRAPLVIFNRHELDTILQTYSRMVMAGEWRDYSLAFESDCATFSIFRRASEGALYRVVKSPKTVQRQGMYAVISAGGRILRRGHNLVSVLAALNTKQLKLV
ncbi:MAG: hypothetical protein CL569_06495 [Alphaproteobacteria bacterium]|nr:hypothetical protein [Alphaproteobacteria bacterium]|tara:strand:+ start:684 stop:1052 length:369 start_codon:yes stop_codon:yes gene_type:complete